VYGIIENDLAKLREKIEEIIKEKTIEKIFDSEEILLSKGCNYFSHVRFEKIM
jgi:hypothetical protein